VTLSGRQVADLLDQHGLTASRALGQNFVIDPNTVRRIARLAGVGPGDRVVEVGPGLGSLTLALAETGAAVTAVELDRHLVPVLREVLTEHAPAAADRLTVVQADAMTLDWSELLAGSTHWSLVANLPYNVATPLVLDLLADVPAIERMLVMVQREVAERLAASPGDPAYGIPSVKVTYWADAKVVGTVSADVFLPRPKVTSALVQIVRRPAPAVEADRSVLFSLIDAGFGQRRKMLRRALASRVAPEQFEQAGVDPTARAEQLELSEWGELARVVAATGGAAST
jgi:16S rRNA (adenine1518-N6/adenine1519-N6)-dimethyltransferase